MKNIILDLMCGKATIDIRSTSNVSKRILLQRILKYVSIDAIDIPPIANCHYYFVVNDKGKLKWQASDNERNTRGTIYPLEDFIKELNTIKNIIYFPLSLSK